jgi:hypothetical protein
MQHQLCQQSDQKIAITASDAFASLRGREHVRALLYKNTFKYQHGKHTPCLRGNGSQG